MKNYSTALFLFISLLISLKSLSQNELQGKWAIYNDLSVGFFEFTQSGHANVMIKGNTLGGEVFMLGTTPVSMTYRTNTSVSPNQIDLVVTMIEYNIVVSIMPGIYEFDGEELKLAIKFDETARPTSFDGDDAIILVKIE